MRQIQSKQFHSRSARTTKMSRDTKTESSLKNLLGPAEPLDFAARFAGVRPGAVPSTPIVWPTDQHAPNQISQIKSISPAQTTFAIPTNQPGRPVVPSKTTPNMVSNVRVTTKQISTPTGTKKQVTVQFTHPPNDPYFAGANIYLHKSGNEPVLVASGAKSPLQFVTDASSVPHAVHVTSVGNQGETDVLKSPAAALSLQVTKSGGGVSSSSANSSATGNLLQVNPTQTDPVTGAPIIQPVPPVKVIGGFPPPTKVSLDNLSDGGTSGRTKQSELVNNTVMRVNDGTNIRTASQLTGVVHYTSGAGAGVIDNAAVIHSRPEGIGTTVQKLNSSGLLVDADQVAADGVTFDRHQHDSHFENILQNGDATNGTLHWFSSGTGGATTVSEADPWGTIRNVIRSGTCSSFDLLNNPGTNSGGAGEIRITPGDTYVYDFWCKTGGTGTWKLFNTNTAGGTSIQTIGAPTGWTHVVAQFTFPTTGTIFYSTGLSLVNTSATADTIDVCAATIRKVRGLDNDVADGVTFVRIGNVNADHTFHVSTSLNNQAVLTGSPAASPSYTSTTTSITWSWGAFTLYFSDGSTVSVSSGSQGFTGLTASTTYFFEFYVVKATATMICVKSDNSTAPASTQFLAQTVGADGHAIEITDITAATTSSGTGGGSGGGGTCFSGDVKVKTPQGFVRMDELGEKCVVVNLTGEHEAEVIVHHNAFEPTRVMPCGSLVTEAHLLRQSDGTWVPASSLFPEKAPQTSRTLYDIHVITENPDDMHYILENGYIAHNKKRVSCFSGDAQILTARGWQRLDKLPSTFTVKNSDGIFPARLVKHEDCSQSVYELPDGSTVTADHFIRRSGQTGWSPAHEVLPPSSKSPSTLFNVIVEGSDHFALSSGFEANDMEGNS